MLQTKNERFVGVIEGNLEANKNERFAHENNYNGIWRSEYATHFPIVR